MSIFEFETTLHNIDNGILKCLKPSQRRSLTGLGDITAERINGFSILENIVKEYTGNIKSVLSKLEKGKCNMKNGYHQHCTEHSSGSNHCFTFALHHPDNLKLSKERLCSFGHNDEYSGSKQLYGTVEEVISFIQSNTFKNAEDLLYDSNTVKDAIIKWMQHIVRHSHQNKTKTDALDMLSESTALWIRDYCQNVLPIKFREQQCYYFGKKGMMLHVDVLLMKPQADIVKVTYFNTVYCSDLGILDSLSIVRHVLE